MNDVKEPAIIPYDDGLRQEVIALWDACGLTRPWNDPNKDIDRKLSDPLGGFFVMVLEDRVIGSVMAGYDGHRGAIYYLSVDPEHQSAGFGRKLMDHCESFLIDLGCPKINLFVRHGNEVVKKFYQDLGYSEETAVPFGKRLIPDT